MMKKIFTVLLAALMILSFAACGTDPVDDQQSSGNPNYEGTLAALVEGIYEKNPLEMMVSQAIDIDITDADALKYYLGLESADDITQAVFSEAMTGSQAYSLCLARLGEGADVDAIKNAILNGVDTQKWICVGADQLIVGNCGDVVIMVMADSQLSETLAEDIYGAFVEITGATGDKLTK